MRRMLLTLLLAMLPAGVDAQRDTAADHQALPRDVRREVANRWNGTNALRASDKTEIAQGRDVIGNVAVQRGPLLIAGDRRRGRYTRGRRQLVASSRTSA
jgi:hypothetical protein